MSSSEFFLVYTPDHVTAAYVALGVADLEALLVC